MMSDYCRCNCGVDTSRNREASGAQISPTISGGGISRNTWTGRQIEALQGSQSHLQGRDKALARRVQNQDWVQGLV